MSAVDVSMPLLSDSAALVQRSVRPSSLARRIGDERRCGGMCNYKVKITDVAEVDDELIAWIKRAYESAG